jgi:hypothetical protein
MSGNYEYSIIEGGFSCQVRFYARADSYGLNFMLIDCNEFGIKFRKLVAGNFHHPRLDPG